MVDYYTFFVISNINTVHTNIGVDDRLRQTIETFRSIRSQVQNSKIVFCDNSTVPLDGGQVSVIKPMVDHWVDYRNNLYTRHINSVGKNKGINELLVYEHMLAEATTHRWIGKRIFKLSGRYQLKETFDIWEYEKPKYCGKYVFRITPWVYNEGAGEFIKYFYNTALWSMCSTLVDHYRVLLPELFSYMLKTGENIEVAHNALVPKEKLVLLDQVHGHGLITNGEYTFF